MARRRLLPGIVVAGLAVAGAAAEQQHPRIPTGAIKKVRDNLLALAGRMQSLLRERLTVKEKALKHGPRCAG
jgi:hypothetical protein